MFHALVELLYKQEWKIECVMTEVPQLGRKKNRGMEIINLPFIQTPKWVLD